MKSEMDHKLRFGKNVLKVTMCGIDGVVDGTLVTYKCGCVFDGDELDEGSFIHLCAVHKIRMQKINVAIATCRDFDRMKESFFELEELKEEIRNGA